MWSLDLFQVESILLQTHWVLVVMDQFTRRIIGFGVYTGAVDGVALCRMLNQVIAGQGLPGRLSLDHDPPFEFARWQANSRILEVEPIQTLPYVPRSHPFIEWLIGTLRREYLGCCFFWNAHDLEKKRETFRHDYNQSRVHQGLDGDAPDEVAGARPVQQASLYDYAWLSHCNGLFELPIAA